MLAHNVLQPGPATAREISFIQTFGKDLRSARDACHRYRRYGDTSDLDKAWDIYYVVRPSINDFGIIISVRSRYSRRSRNNFLNSRVWISNTCRPNSSRRRILSLLFQEHTSLAESLSISQASHQSSPSLLPNKGHEESFSAVPMAGTTNTY